MIYEYQCPTCQRVKEVDHSIKESPVVECSEGHPATQCTRLISTCSFLLKGTCWAKDCYSTTSSNNEK